MQRVTMIKTSDGNLHCTLEKAMHHAEERYGEGVTRLAHRAIKHDKYRDMCEFIETHLDEFVELKALSEDRKMEETEDEE